MGFYLFTDVETSGEIQMRIFFTVSTLCIAGKESTFIQMRTEFWEIGVQYGLTAAGLYCTPNFEEWGPHLLMRPSQTHCIHIVINLIRVSKD